MDVDGAAGGATATGLGEAVMKTVGSFLVVELMRQGALAQEAQTLVRRQRNAIVVLVHLDCLRKYVQPAAV